MKKLVIDLGHGGSDPGAVGQNGTHEADVILAIGKEIDLLLKGYKVNYKFTRLSNTGLSLLEIPLQKNIKKLQILLMLIILFLYI